MKKIDQSDVMKAMKSRPVLWTIILLCGCLIFITAIEFTYPLLSKKTIWTDFNVFYMAGQMFWEGNLDHAYHAESMLEAQTRFTGTNSFMPWAYPPQFNFIAAALALLPIGLSYLIFVSLSFVAYLLVLRHIAGPYSSATLFAIAPALFVLIRCGQNGFLTGSLAGLFFLAFLKNRSTAGLPLGLMIIKPQLAIGMTVLALISRRWNTLAIAAGVVAVTSLLATLAFGSGIWLAFADGAREASLFLQSGLYPLFRMTSIYAALYTFGVPAGIALAVQGFSFVAACFLIGYAWAKNWGPRRIAGIAALASLFMSPYAFDYDLPMFGIAIAFLMSDIAMHSSNKEKLFLLLLSWIACGWGMLESFKLQHILSSPEFPPDDQPYAIAGISLLFLLVMILAIIRRAVKTERK